MHLFSLLSSGVRRYFWPTSTSVAATPANLPKGILFVRIRLQRNLCRFIADGDPGDTNRFFA
jgi:hypothetical protein